MILELIGVLGPVSAAWCLLRRTSARATGIVICVCAACGLGLGAASLLWWALLQLPGMSAARLVMLDVAIWSATLLGLGFSSVMARRRAGPASRSSALARPSQRRWGIAASVAVVAPLSVLAVTTFAAISAVLPHGSWDAWAIWNSRARFLYLGLPTLWRDAFSPGLAWSHPDYPLLLPASVARLWTFGGHETVAVPIALSAMFAAGLVLLAGVSIGRERSAIQGWLTSAFILAIPTFMIWAPSQGADVPLAFYILLTFVLASAADTSDRPSALWALAGLAAGLAAWTKNEGVVFAVAFFFVWTMRAWRSRDRRPIWPRTLAVLGGAAAPLAVLAWFKLSVAPPNDVISAQPLGHVMELLTNGDRIAAVLSAVGQGLWYSGADTVGVLPLLGLYVLAVGVRRGESSAAGLTFATLAILLMVYVATYVITPHNLNWHLKTSLDRLLLHLLPSLVWAAMLMTAFPGESLRHPARNSPINKSPNSV